MENNKTIKFIGFDKENDKDQINKIVEIASLSTMIDNIIVTKSNDGCIKIYNGDTLEMKLIVENTPSIEKFKVTPLPSFVPYDVKIDYENRFKTLLNTINPPKGIIEIKP